jgi:hypothetical protein
MSEEMLPVIRWHEGMIVPKPEGHVPRYVEVGIGRVIDEALLAWILDALLAEHPDADRLRQVITERPGLSARRQDDGMIVVMVATGEPFGLFDPRLLDA